MNPFEFVFVILFGLLGLAMIVWVVQIFWRAIMPTVSKGGQLSPVALKENWNLKKRFSMIAEIDEDIKSKKIDSACKKIKEVFILEHIKGNDAVLESIRAHNYLALTKVIAVSQEAKTQLPSISAVENLLDERSRLLSLFKDSSILHEKISEKRRREGKGDSWDGGEFESRIAELSDDIEKNRHDLREAIDDLLAVLMRRGSRDVNIH